MIEIFGVITGIIYVFLEARQNKLLWPLGILTSAVYIWIFFDTKFYADMGLQVYYVLISIYGWYYWTKNIQSKPSHERGRIQPKVKQVQECSLPDNPAPSPEKKPTKVKVSHTPPKTTALLLITFAAAWALLYYILHEFTDSTVPLGDSFTTALALVATWMLTRKFIEQWYLWMIANSVSIALYIYKGLYPTVILYAVYAAMSVYGYYEWKKSMK